MVTIYYYITLNYAHLQLPKASALALSLLNHFQFRFNIYVNLNQPSVAACIRWV